MDEHCSLAPLLGVLPRECLARTARLLASSARRDHARGNAGVAVWRQAVQQIIEAHLAQRSGQAVTGDERAVRAATRSMSSRELVILVTELEQAIADVEGHGCGAPMQLNQRLLSDARQVLALQRTMARPSSRTTVKELASRLVAENDGRSSVHRDEKGVRRS